MQPLPSLPNGRENFTLTLTLGIYNTSVSKWLTKIRDKRFEGRDQGFMCQRKAFRWGETEGGSWDSLPEDHPQLRSEEYKGVE